VSRQEEQPDVVFDTMIVFQAAANTEGPAAELFRRLEVGWFNLYVSPEILNEMRDVLSRPKLRAKNRHITDESVHKVFESLSRFARSVSGVPSTFSPP
jgi:predicted nucleic acid-binding protein